MDSRASSIAGQAQDSGNQNQPLSNWAYGAGLDIGLKRHRAAFVVVGRHAETGAYRLAKVLSWKPTETQKVNLEQVERAILQAHQCFRIQRILMDPWQGDYLCDRLLGERVPTTLYPFSEPNLDELARHAINLFTERRIQLFEDALLSTDLRQMSVVERASGKLRQRFPETEHGHGDVGTAFVLALLAAQQCHSIPEEVLHFRPFAISCPAWLRP